MIEFTGERVVPGQVDADLWNEHLARYAFAEQFTAGKRVLDAGCGSGYGSARLAAKAEWVVGVDNSPEAIAYAREHYAGPNLRFEQASCLGLPLPGGAVEAVTAFEVIEHLDGWEKFLSEIKRVLMPSGVLVISTPNKSYYAEARKVTGPNPFHVREFDAEEFSRELRARFPQVLLYSENHVAAVALAPTDGSGGEPHLECGATGQAEDAHFLLAVCSRSKIGRAGPWIYVPTTANVLRERELHIEKLETDVTGLKAEKQELVEMFRAQKAELEKSNTWAAELDEKLKAAQARIVQLQDEAVAMRAGYEARIAEMEEEIRRNVEWAQQLESRLEEKGKELLDTIAHLDDAERRVIERTEWAKRLGDQLSLVRASRWVKLGNRFGLGPRLPAE